EHGAPERRPASVDEDVDQATLVALAVSNRSRGESVEGVVATPAHVVPGMDTSAALANDHGTGVDDLAVEHLGAETLGCRIAAVLAGTTGFGLGHLFTPLRRRRRETRPTPIDLGSSPWTSCWRTWWTPSSASGRWP